MTTMTTMTTKKVAMDERGKVVPIVWHECNFGCGDYSFRYIHVCQPCQRVVLNDTLMLRIGCVLSSPEWVILLEIQKADVLSMK